MTRLTVSEYAEMQGISVQAVYKRLDRLKTVEETRNGRKIRLIEVEDRDIQPDSTNSTCNSTNSTPKEVELNPDIQPIKPNFNPEFQPIQPELNPEIQPPAASASPVIDFPAIISILEKQLEEKDRQIEKLQDEAKEKDQQIKEQFDRLTGLLLRSQELEAQAQKLLGEPEKPIEAETREELEVIQEESAANEREQQTKKSWFSRLFKK